MLRLSLLALVCATGALPAQSNTVPGLDGRLTVLDNLTYWGRRGGAHPGGEVGMSMRNTMCNPGSVDIPWQAAMAPNHPMFGFLIMRERDGRFEQISDWSFCKHAFTSINVNGQCGGCQDPGTGSLMGINCSDTYSAGNNASRTWLGPPAEIDPWLGVWDPIGSYFDIGDPNQPGYPLAADGVRSLSASGFDSVSNRVTVQEQDLLTANADYYYGIILIHRGEALANRGDNFASRGFVPAWSGSSWSFANNGVPQSYGSILQHWSGSTMAEGGNGADDGRFVVARKIDDLGGGQWHYEYTVHNLDNHRGGATFRVPFDPTGNASNFTFRDIDGDALNDWAASVVGSEVVFQSGGDNALNWNTVFNFGFDCDVAPSLGLVSIDQARVGPGQPSVQIDAEVPSGIPTAFVTSVGQGCGDCASSFYESLPTGSFDLANSAMGLRLISGDYVVGAATGAFVTPAGSDLGLGDDDEAAVNLPFSLPYPGGSTSQVVVCSNGFVSAGFGNGTAFTPSTAGLLGGSAPCWSAAWHDFNPSASGQVLVDSSASVVRISYVDVPNFSGAGTGTFQYEFLPSGTVNVYWQQMSNNGNGYVVGYSPGGGAQDPGGIDVSAELQSGFSLCATNYTGLGFTTPDRPVLGTTMSLDTVNIPAGTAFGAVLLSFEPATPPTDLGSQGMPGCFAYLQNGLTFDLFLAPAGTASSPFVIPNIPSFTGVPLVSQSFSYSPPLTPLGVIASNGLILTFGPQ